MVHLELAKGLSDKQAKRLFHSAIRFGDHFERGYQFLSNEDARARLEAEGYDVVGVLKSLRADRKATIPKFENFLSLSPAYASVSGGIGVEVSLVRSDGAVLQSSASNGADQVYAGPEWQALLGDSLRAYRRTIETGEKAAANSMLIYGFAAIEAFLNLEAHSYSIDHPGADLTETLNACPSKTRLIGGYLRWWASEWRSRASAGRRYSDWLRCETMALFIPNQGLVFAACGTSRRQRMTFRPVFAA